MSWSTTVPVDRPVVIVHTLSGKVLGISTDTFVDPAGRPAGLFPADDAADVHYQWRVIGMGHDAIGDRVAFVNLDTGEFLEADSATLSSPFTMARVKGSVLPPAANQIWRLAPGAPDAVTIASVQAHGRLLTGDLLTLDTADTIVQLEDTDATAITRQWLVVPVEDFAPAGRSVHSFNGAPTNFDLLIVTSADFAGLFDAYRAAKAKHGVRTHLVTLTATPDGRCGLLDNFSGIDNPERIKYAIANAHRLFEARYVMLVGDASIIPTRMVFDRSAEPNTNGIVGDYRPSDLYYACLYHHGATGVVPITDLRGTQIANELIGQFSSWDLNGDNCYNDSLYGTSALTYNPDGVDGYPDIALGRVPARTSSDVTAYLNKVEAYESSTFASPSPKTWSFLADGAYPGSQSDCDAVKSAIPEGMSATVRSELITTSPFNMGEVEKLESGWSAADDTTLQQLASSSWWLGYIGHGDSSSWDYAPGEFDAVINQLKNTTYPIVFAAACETGEYLNLPPNGAYQDSARMFRWYSQDANPLEWTILDSNGTQTGSVTGPLTVPTPSGYDLSIIPPTGNGQSSANRTLGCAWLFNPTGGGIAYFGEILICEDDKGTELQRDLVASFGQLDATTVRSLGDAWVLAQRQYFKHNCNYGPAPGSVDTLRHPRIYLGIMTFFGDPSLQLCLPNVAPPPRPPVVNPNPPVVHPPIESR